jgi:hypothetical protein
MQHIHSRDSVSSTATRRAVHRCCCEVQPLLPLLLDVPTMDTDLSTSAGCAQLQVVSARYMCAPQPHEIQRIKTKAMRKLDQPLQRVAQGVPKAFWVYRDAQMDTMLHSCHSCIVRIWHLSSCRPRQIKRAGLLLTPFILRLAADTISLSSHAAGAQSCSAHMSLTCKRTPETKS